MSTCKITYNGNEISSAKEAYPVSVTYGGNQIASVSDGESKTLNCNGLFMTGNVVAGSKTLNCENTVMVSDVAISVEPSVSTGETWYFNDTLPEDSKQLMFIFNANNMQFFGIQLVYSDRWGLVTHDLKYLSDVTTYAAYHNGDWNEELRTIVLDEPATGDVLAFLEANATKIS